MKRHLFATFLTLAACGGKTTPASDDTEPDRTIDAAPVAVAPDAAPYVPNVETQMWSNDIADLQTQLKSSSDDAERLVLFAQLGDALFHSACKVAETGACETMVPRGKKAAATCDGHTEDRKIVARTAKVVDEANAAFGEVRQLWGDGSAIKPLGTPLSAADDAAYTSNVYVAHAVARALLVIGDEHFETMLAVPRPTGLDNGSKKAAQATAKKLAGWFDAFTKEAAEASNVYAQVYGDPTFSQWAPLDVVDAMWRVAEIQDYLVNDLRGMEIPKDLAKDEAKRKDYCAALEVQAAQVVTDEIATLQQCVEFQRAHRDPMAGEASDLCKIRIGELQQPTP